MSNDWADRPSNAPQFYWPTIFLVVTTLSLSGTGCSDLHDDVDSIYDNQGTTQVGNSNGIRYRVELLAKRDVVSGEKCTARVTFSNRRSTAVRVRDALTSCGCTEILVSGKTAVFPYTIASNSSLEFEVVIDTLARVGQNVFGTTFAFEAGNDSWGVEVPINIDVAHGIFCDPPLFFIDVDDSEDSEMENQPHDLQVETTVFRDVDTITYRDLKICCSNPTTMQWEAVELETAENRNPDGAIARVKIDLSPALSSLDSYLMEYVWIELQDCPRRIEIPITIRRTRGGVQFSPNLMSVSQNRLERRVIFRSRPSNSLNGLVFVPTSGVSGIVDNKSPNLAIATLQFKQDVLLEDFKLQPVRFLLNGELVAEIQVVVDRSASQTGGTPDPASLNESVDETVPIGG